MIPTCDQVLDVWQKAAAHGEDAEPYLFAAPRTADSRQIVAATFSVDDDPYDALANVAFHLWLTDVAHEPEWVACVTPAYHLDRASAQEWASLRPGELAERFAAGDERVLDVLVAHVVTLDGTTVRVYVQPLLSPAGHTITNPDGRLVQALENILVALHRSRV